MPRLGFSMTPSDFSLWLYSFQALMIGALLIVAVRRDLLRVQVFIWTIGVIAIAWRYGLDDQLIFYSNDQIQYTRVVRILWSGDWPTQSSWWFDGAKIPYTASALPLVLIGIHETLALKAVSLIAFLILSQTVINRLGTLGISKQVRTLYISGCGLIGGFFTLLALRETMMMLCVYMFATAKSPAVRVFSLIIVMLLRPHLAVAFLIAELVATLWSWIQTRRSIGAGLSPTFMIAGTLIGNSLFTLRVRDLRGTSTPFFNDWGIREVIQIASNYVGLQFLTAENWNVSFGLTDLILLRFVLSETVVIPTLFTVLMLVGGSRVTRLHMTTLLAFSIYVSIAANTDFNSFRQNLPFMPLMGLAITAISGSRGNDDKANGLMNPSPLGANSVGGSSTAPRET